MNVFNALLFSLVGSYRKTPTWLIWLMVVISIVINNLSPRVWNLYHYYINSKYFEELGYTELYECTLLLLPEGEIRRSLVDYRFIEADVLPDCRANFTESRWHEFQADFEETNLEKMIGLRDKGLNALPSWIFLGQIIANNFSIDAVILIDQVFMLIAMMIVIRLLGFRRAGYAFLFIVCFYGVFDRLWGNYAQYIWLALSLAGTAFIQKKHSRLGGLLIGLAAGLRIFPLFLLIGRDRKAMLWGLLGIGITLYMGLLTPQRETIYADFIQNMLLHSSHITHEPLNLGLRQTLTMISSPNDAMRHVQFLRGESHEPFSYSGYSLVLYIPLAILAAASPIGLMFALITLSRYYYTIISVIALEHEEKMIRRALLTNGLFMLVWIFSGERIGFTYGQLLWLLFFASFWKLEQIKQFFARFELKKSHRMEIATS